MNPMPIWPSLSIVTIDDFLHEVEKLFDEITGSWSPILFKKEFRQQITAAWDEIKKDARTSLSAIQGEFAKVANDLKAKAGLIGEQLKLKFAGLINAWKIFDENGTVKFLRKLLSWVNAILASLATVAPGAEAWKEFKEAIEKFIELTE